jgi:hypothetical protein
MPCFKCGRIQTDPAKGKSPWGRAVVEGKQVLICPQCQVEDPAWEELAERCSACGSIRLHMMLGEIVCRECGATREGEVS